MLPVTNRVSSSDITPIRDVPTDELRDVQKACGKAFAITAVALLSMNTWCHYSANSLSARVCAEPSADTLKICFSLGLGLISMVRGLVVLTDKEE